MLSGTILSKVGREWISEKTEPRVGAGKRMSHVTIWGQKNNCKGPEEESCLSLKQSNTEKRLVAGG